MTRGRLEAFSDGVMAIIITIMVIELRAPHGDEPAVLRPLVPVVLSYLLSYVHLGIYWSNHHHLFQAVRHVDGRVLWANLHLLFWLSLVPFVTAWMGENEFSAWPVALYGAVLLCAAIAYYILTRVLLARDGDDSALAAALGGDFQGEALARALRRRHRARLLAVLGGLRTLRRRGADVARPGPPDRADADPLTRAPGGLTRCRGSSPFRGRIRSRVRSFGWRARCGRSRPIRASVRSLAWRATWAQLASQCRLS